MALSKAQRKRCGRCKKYRSKQRSFNTDNGAPDKLFRWCRKCQSIHYQEWYGRNLDKIYARNIKQKYNLSIRQYKAMFEDQDGKCWICRKPPIRRRLSVDHDHKTGKVRGLLCDFCNYFFLGKTHSTSEILRRAADYIDNPPGVPLIGGPPPYIPVAERLLRKIRSRRPKRSPNNPL